jgi:hypothetical protein
MSEEEHLHTKQEILSSNPSTTNKNKNQKKLPRIGFTSDF